MFLVNMHMGHYGGLKKVVGVDMVRDTVIETSLIAYQGRFKVYSALYRTYDGNICW
jgi:hypothetical protein